MNASTPLPTAHEALATFREKLSQLRTEAGSPSLRVLETLAATLGDRLPKSSIQEKLHGKTMPDLDFVLAFVRACLLHAEKMGRTLLGSLADAKAWEDAQLEVVRAVDRARGDRALTDWAGRELRGHIEKFWVAPRQLPHAPRHFAGREAEQRALSRMLDQVGGAGTVVISSIEGAAGVGKTALALHWAHQVADRFADGQLYLNLRGFDPVAEPFMPNEAIRTLLDGMGVPPSAIPHTFEAQVGLYRALLAGKQVLILLDNARTAEQVRPLLPSSPTAHVLVTSRNRLTGLVAIDGAEQITVDLLAAEEARLLLSKRLGPHRREYDDIVNDIVNSCARLPLALCVVAARAAMQPGIPLSEVSRQLADDRLGTLDGGEPLAHVRAAFSWSYRALSSDAARLFRLLSLHPGPDLAAAGAASLAGIPIEQAQPLLAMLSSFNMITESIPGRYGLHDLLRVYAAEQAREIDTTRQRQSARKRMLDYYLHTAYSASMMLYTHRQPIALAEAEPGTYTEVIADHGQARVWFAAEHAALLSVFDYAAAAARHTYTWQLAWALTIYFDQKGLWHDLVRIQGTALAAAQQGNDLTGQVRARHNLVHAHIRLEQLTDAHAHLLQLVQLNLVNRDKAEQAHTYCDLAEVLERQGKFADALDYATRALHLYQTVNHPRGQAGALGTCGWLHARLGNHEQALLLCHEALNVHQRLGNDAGLAEMWGRLGGIHRDFGRYQNAITCYQKALNIYREHHNSYGKADILDQLGDTHHAMANTEAARAAWQHALDTFAEIGHHSVTRIRFKLFTVTQAEIIPAFDQTPDDELSVN